MGYQWDPAKARANARKHGIEFADAVGVFEDPFGSTLDDPRRPSTTRTRTRSGF